MTTWPAARIEAEERTRAYRRHGAPCPDCSIPPREYVYHSIERPCPYAAGSRRWRVARFAVRLWSATYGDPDFCEGVISGSSRALALCGVIGAAWWGLSSASPETQELVGLVLAGAGILGLVRFLDLRAGGEPMGGVTSRGRR